LALLDDSNCCRFAKQTAYACGGKQTARVSHDEAGGSSGSGQTSKKTP